MVDAFHSLLWFDDDFLISQYVGAGNPVSSAGTACFNKKGLEDPAEVYFMHVAVPYDGTHVCGICEGILCIPHLLI